MPHLATRRRLVATTLGALLAVSPAPGAFADRPPESAPGSSSAADLPDLALAPAGESVLVGRDDVQVAPGVTHTSFDRLDARGWVRGDVLVADLDAQGVQVEYLNPGSVSGREVLSEQAARVGAVAAVNGDFFDINDTGAPLGVGIARDGDGGAGVLVNGPAAGHNQTVAIGADGLGRLAEVFLEGSADDGESTVTLTNLNSPTVARGGVGLYTPAWGEAGRDRTVDGASAVREVVVADGVVTGVADAAGRTPLAEGEVALVGRERGADALAGFEVGERVGTTYGPRSDAGELAVAVGGNRVLLRDGAVQPVDDVALHPRTAVGFSEDGRRMVLVTVDGRQRDSRGLTERELGELMADLGADDALNLDGGGSSTMLAREPGDAPTVVNSPSDGGQRLTPNGLGLVPASGSGVLTGFHVEPATADDPDDRGERDRRVLTGLSRVVEASGHDETYASVTADPRWTATPSGVGRVEPAGDGQAVVTGRAPGDLTVTASSGAARGSVELAVLGRPVRVEASTPQVSLADGDDTTRFQVLGYDQSGFGTWVEPRDVRVEVDPAVAEVTADGDGFVVRPATDSGAAVVTLRVGDLSAAMGVTVGLRSEVVDTMDDASRWRATRFPAPVQATASAAAGRDGGGAVALDYSLTGTTATRAAYLQVIPQLTLPGSPQRIGAWVHGDGQGAWLRANVYDAAGGAAKTVNLAAKVDWTGWRYVEAEVPAGLTMPLRFFRLYVVETNPARQYAGRIVVDDLTVAGAQTIDLPAAKPPVDDVVVTDGTVVEDGRWRFAVLSDVQFTADAPESDLVAQGRRTIREALAADPELLVVNGDFVDRGFDRDIALAKRVLDEEVGGRVPVHYVPGNHESYGPGDLSEWRKVFGEPSRVFDHRGTRFVQLDSSLGSLRAGGFEQITMLRDALDDAARDAGVNDVVVLAHHPVDDPAPTDNSQLADRKEAQLLVDWLADFRAETGKGAAYLASHAGTFAASRQDGVLLPLVGNAGKGPSAAPDAGGFTGWALVGITERPAPAAEAVRHRAGDRDADGWLRVEMRPHVDALELDAPTALAVGGTAAVRATVVQDGRRVPVAYPVSADWAGAGGLHVGTPDDAPPGAVAAFDPASGRLVGLRAGQADLSVTVNGVTRTVRVTVG